MHPKTHSHQWLPALITATLLACLTVNTTAQTARPPNGRGMNTELAAFRASPLYVLSKIQLKDVNLTGKTFSDAIEWLDQQIPAGMTSNKLSVRIEVRPLDIKLPSYPPALEPIISGRVAELRDADETWRAEIASNVTRRVTVEGKKLTALDVLRTICSQADLLYADDGAGVVIGNVYLLRWPPQIACGVFPVEKELVTKLGDRIKGVVAPASFHDFRRDWITLVSEQNVLVVFHHPDMLDAMASSVEYANKNADAIIARSNPLPLGGKKNSLK